MQYLSFARAVPLQLQEALAMLQDTYRQPDVQQRQLAIDHRAAAF